jgi:hypothetical protein
MEHGLFRPFAVLAALAVAGCQMQTLSPVAGSPVDRFASMNRRASSSVELFVADWPAGLVYVYAIKNGLPVPALSRLLWTPRPITNIAVAGDGTIYVASQGAGIEVYEPGAHGFDRPERVLSVPVDAWSVAVDPQGYVYAGLPNVGVNVYAPGAQGNDLPVASIPEKAFVGGFGFDAVGNLYVTTNDEGLTEYATPENDPTEVKRTCFDVGDLNGVVVNSSGEAFVAVDGNGYETSYSYVAPVASHDYGCPAQRHRIYAKPSLHDPVGIAELSGHLFVGDGAYPGGAAVVVMDEAKRGHDMPLFVLTNPNFQHPRGVAIGP